MITRQHIEPDFFDDAEAMRAAFDARFSDRYGQMPRWAYFCVPQQYTYLRAPPQEVLPAPLFERFMERLRQWCLDQLGLVPMGFPYLHLMIDGCRLELHSDFHNGVWGYVYSLTRWENRTFSGGETLLMRDGVPSYQKHHVHGDVLYELIPARFNQLLVFDDRIVHATPVIEGSMDPLHARIAMVGHIRAASPVCVGALSNESASKVIHDGLRTLVDPLKPLRNVQGTISFRLTVAASGNIESTTVLTDNLVTQAIGYEASDEVAAAKRHVQQMLSRLRFEPAVSGSSITFAVLLPLPNLQRIEIDVPHAGSLEALQRSINTGLEHSALGIRGDWNGSVFHVRQPIAGSIRIEPRHVLATFDPPMWVPSQRERFAFALSEGLKRSAAIVSSGAVHQTAG